MSRPRLFVALPLPRGARRALARVGRCLAAGARSGRPRVPPEEQIHLTLRFFGAGVEPRGTEESLRSALSPERGPRLAAEGLGAFPSLRRARVGFAKVVEIGGGHLPRLHRAAERVARECGLPGETRRFVPHVTLLRLRRPVALGASLLAGAATRLPPDAFVVPEARLIASTLAPTGATYRLLARIPLSPA